MLMFFLLVVFFLSFFFFLVFFILTYFQLVCYSVFLYSCISSFMISCFLLFCFFNKSSSYNPIFLSYNYVFLLICFFSCFLVMCSTDFFCVFVGFFVGGTFGSFCMLYGLSSSSVAFYSVLFLNVFFDTILYVFLFYYFLDMSYGVSGFLDFEDMSVFSLFFMSFVYKSGWFLFGFWVYFAMDAGYFVSCYIHSSGVMFLGLCVWIKLMPFFGNGVLCGYFVFYFCFLGVVFCFILVMFSVNFKSSLGYLTCMSYNLMFMVSFYNLHLLVVYFFMHSILKSSFFVFVFLMKGSSEKKVYMMMFLVFLQVLFLSFYSMFNCPFSGDFSFLESVVYVSFLMESYAYFSVFSSFFFKSFSLVLSFSSMLDYFYLFFSFLLVLFFVKFEFYVLFLLFFEHYFLVLVLFISKFIYDFLYYFSYFFKFLDSLFSFDFILDLKKGFGFILSCMKFNFSSVLLFLNENMLFIFLSLFFLFLLL